MNLLQQIISSKGSAHLLKTSMVIVSLMFLFNRTHCTNRVPSRTGGGTRGAYLPLTIFGPDRRKTFFLLNGLPKILPPTNFWTFRRSWSRVGVALTDLRPHPPEPKYVQTVGVKSAKNTTHHIYSRSKFTIHKKV